MSECLQFRFLTERSSSRKAPRLRLAQRNLLDDEAAVIVELPAVAIGDFPQMAIGV